MSDNPTQQTHDPRSFEERVFARFDALDSRISSLEGKVDEMNGRLTTLEDKVDSRLRETRPIWEAVLTRLGAIENSLNSIESRLDEVEKELRKLGHTVLLIHEDNLHIRADQRDLRGRVEKLESQSTR
jgi:chromosome segregation ATPase